MLGTELSKVEAGLQGNGFARMYVICVIIILTYSCEVAKPNIPYYTTMLSPSAVRPFKASEIMVLGFGARQLP